MRRAWIVAAILCSISGAAEARCYARWTFHWGGERDSHWETDGGSCVTRLGGTRGTGEVHSFKIATAARHGTALASGSTVSYRPRPGYKGDDSFVFVVIGNADGVARQATVRVRVTVR